MRYADLAKAVELLDFLKAAGQKVKVTNHKSKSKRLLYPTPGTPTSDMSPKLVGYSAQIWKCFTYCFTLT